LKKQSGHIFIPIALTIVFILSICTFTWMQNRVNQNAMMFRISNIEKSRQLAESAIEIANYKIRKDANEVPGMTTDLASYFKEIVQTFEKGGTGIKSWAFKARIPALVVNTTASTMDPSATGTLTLTVDGVLKNFSKNKCENGDWSSETLKLDGSADDFGLKKLIEEIGGDASKTKISCTIKIKDMRPIVSDKGLVLWKSAEVTLDKLKEKVQKALTKPLSKFLDKKVNIEINILEIIAKVIAKSCEIKIKGVKVLDAEKILKLKDGIKPDAIIKFFCQGSDGLFKEGELGAVKLDTSALMEKLIKPVLKKPISWLFDFLESGLDTLFAEIKIDGVIEKLATVHYDCLAEYYPAGSAFPVSTRIEATRDLKVVDIGCAPEPLHSFFWLNEEDKKYPPEDWGRTGASSSASAGFGGVFRINNLNLDPTYSGKFSISQIFDFFNGILSGEIIRFPGKCYIGGSGPHELPTGINDFLLVYPEHLPPFSLLDNPGFLDGIYLPSQLMSDIFDTLKRIAIPAGKTGKKVNLPIPFVLDATIWFPNVPMPPMGMVGMVDMLFIVVPEMIMKKNFTEKAKTQLFGEFALSPTLNGKVDGNVKKIFLKNMGVGFTVPTPFFGAPVGLGAYSYMEQKKPYTYSFIEKIYEDDEAPEPADEIANLYEKDQYEKKASYVYENGEEFLNDSTTVDSNNQRKIDGVTFIKGDLELSGDNPFFGSGLLVVDGDLKLKKCNIIHEYIKKDETGTTRTVPFGIICFKKVIMEGNCNIRSSVYAEEGIEINGGSIDGMCNIFGNLVCKAFDPKMIGGNLTVWYTPEVTSSSLLSLIPGVGRFIPDRYRVILSKRFSTFKVVALQ